MSVALIVVAGVFGAWRGLGEESSPPEPYTRSLGAVLIAAVDSAMQAEISTDWLRADVLDALHDGDALAISGRVEEARALLAEKARDVDADDPQLWALISRRTIYREMVGQAPPPEGIEAAPWRLEQLLLRETSLSRNRRLVLDPLLWTLPHAVSSDSPSHALLLAHLRSVARAGPERAFRSLRAAGYPLADAVALALVTPAGLSFDSADWRGPIERLLTEWIDNAERAGVCDRLAEIAVDGRRRDRDRRAAAWALARIGTLPFALMPLVEAVEPEVARRPALIAEAWTRVRSMRGEDGVRARVGLAHDELSRLESTWAAREMVADWHFFHTGRKVPAVLSDRAPGAVEEWLLQPGQLVPECTDAELLNLLSVSPSRPGETWRSESLLAVLELRHDRERGVPWRIEHAGPYPETGAADWREILEIAPAARRIVAAWVDYDDGGLRVSTSAAVRVASTDASAFWTRPPRRVRWRRALSTRPAIPGLPVVDARSYGWRRDGHPRAFVSYSPTDAGFLAVCAEWWGPSVNPDSYVIIRLGFFRSLVRPTLVRSGALGTREVWVEGGRVHDEPRFDVLVEVRPGGGGAVLVWAEELTEVALDGVAACERAVTRALDGSRADAVRESERALRRAEVVAYSRRFEPSPGSTWAATFVPVARAREDLLRILHLRESEVRAESTVALAAALAGETGLFLDSGMHRFGDRMPGDFFGMDVEKPGNAFWVDVLVRTDDLDVARHAFEQLVMASVEPDAALRALLAAKRLGVELSAELSDPLTSLARHAEATSLREAFVRRPRVQLAALGAALGVLFASLLLLRGRARRVGSATPHGGLLLAAWAIVIGLSLVVANVWLDVIDLVPDALGWFVVAVGVRRLGRATLGLAGPMAFAFAIAAAGFSAASQLWMDTRWLASAASISAMATVLSFAPLARALVLAVPRVAEPPPRRVARVGLVVRVTALVLAATVAAVFWVVADAGQRWLADRSAWLALIALTGGVAAWTRLAWRRDGPAARIGGALPPALALAYGVPCAALIAHFAVIPWYGNAVWPFDVAEFIWTAQIVAAIGALWCVARLLDAAAWADAAPASAPVPATSIRSQDSLGGVRITGIDAADADLRTLPKLS